MNNDPSNKRLSDEENYKTTFSLGDLDASLLIYNRIAANFVKDIAEDIEIADLSHFIYVVEKGVETITNIYKTLLLYTKNNELAEYHTEKACVYYIEFISQLGNDINVREAVLFVFKKTIFEINNECKKHVNISAEQNVYFTILNETSEFIQKFIKSVISDHNVGETAGILNQKIIEYSRKLNFSNDLTDTRLVKLKFLNSLIAGLSILKCEHIRMFNILDSVLKKMVKMECVGGASEMSFSMEKLTNAIDNNYSPLKTASQLFLT
jgi:hypothetical protein